MHPYSGQPLGKDVPIIDSGSLPFIEDKLSEIEYELMLDAEELQSEDDQDDL